MAATAARMACLPATDWQEKAAAPQQPQQLAAAKANKELLEDQEAAKAAAGYMSSYMAWHIALTTPDRAARGHAATSWSAPPEHLIMSALPLASE